MKVHFFPFHSIPFHFKVRFLMTMLGDGAASYESTGAGGKFRKRPFRRPQTTPYDRPLNSIRNPNSKGWLSKLVDPASKLIMASAQFFFSSVFQKRLTPPQQVPHPQPGANQEQVDKLQKAISDNHIEACNTFNDQVGSPRNNSGGNPVFDLEQLLKQKTFTRSESDSLMALLRSRTVELPVGVEDRTEKNLSQPSSDHENKMERSQAIVSSPIVDSKGIRENAASPSELAKAYMQSSLREDTTLKNNQSLALTIRSPAVLSQSSNSSGLIGVHDNGFISTKYRGRSAIYSMARSPYFGVHPTTQKDLKQISAVMDDEMGSSGVTRRVRRKPNLSPQKSLLSNLSKHKTSKAVVENGHGVPFSKAVVENGHGVRFPSESSEMGTKIMQHFEKLSPNQKPSELKLVDGSEKLSPTKLASNMLIGQALRSLDHVDSSKFMRSSQNNHHFDDVKKDTVVENGQQMLAASHDMVACPIHTDTAADSVKDTLHNVTGSENNDPILKAQPTQRGRTFQMSAFEDSVDLDEEISFDEPPFSLSVERREKAEERDKTEKSMVEIVAVPTKAFEADKVTVNSVYKEKTNSKGGSGVVILEENSGFTFFTPSVTTTPLKAAHHTESVSVLDKPLHAKAPNDSCPVFSFNPKVNIVPSSVFSLPSMVNESADDKLTTPVASKPETTNSLENVSSGTTYTQPRLAASGKDTNKDNDNNIIQNGGDTKGILETPSTPSTSKVFSFGAPNNNSDLNNQPPSSSAFIPSSTYPLLPFTSFANTPTVTSLAAEVPSVPAPTFTDDATFLKTPSTVPLMALTSSIDKTADSKFKTENKVSFGNQNALPFSSESFPTVIAGSTLSGICSSVANPTLDNQSQAPLFVSGSGSLISSTHPSSSSAIPPSTSVKTLFSSSTSAANIFSSSSSFGLTSSTSSSVTVSVNTASGFSSTPFSSSLQQVNKSPVYHNPFTSSNLSTGFSFGAPPTSSTATSTDQMVFGSTPSSGPTFSFGSTPSSGPSFSFGSTPSSGPSFSFGSTPSSGPSFSFSSASLSTSTTSAFPPPSKQPPAFSSTPFSNAGPTNNNQMSMEDGMAEDPVQASAPGFGQQSVFSPQPGSMLGSMAPLPGNPFQFGGQTAPENQSPLPFQASGSLEFNAAGSFSLGSGGGEKSSRRTVKVSKIRNRKKP